MEMPEKVKIGYAEYSIKSWNIIEASREARYGDYDHERLNIRISDGIAPPVRATVLLHEIFHGIVQHFNVPVENNEEGVVASISEGLAQVIHDNPDLITWITTALQNEPTTKKKS